VDPRLFVRRQDRHEGGPCRMKVDCGIAKGMAALKLSDDTEVLTSASMTALASGPAGLGGASGAVVRCVGPDRIPSVGKCVSECGGSRPWSGCSCSRRWWGVSARQPVDRRGLRAAAVRAAVRGGRAADPRDGTAHRPGPGPRSCCSRRRTRWSRRGRSTAGADAVDLVGNTVFAVFAGGTDRARRPGRPPYRSPTCAGAQDR
jgi:hypothetical protein